MALIIKLPEQFILLMKKLMPYVKSQPERSLTMHKLSEVGNVDIIQLYETVTANLYKSPRALTRSIRLDKSAHLLATTDMSIEQVALECGFYTPNYFIGNFFHVYKQTPTEYRQSHRK